MNLWLIPASDSTATNNLSKSLTKALSKNRLATTELPDGSSEIYAWGSKAGKKDTNVNKWQNMAPGDLCLFYTENPDGKGKAYTLAANVVETKRSTELSLSFWDEQAFELIYFLDKPRKVDLTVNQLSDAFMPYREDYMKSAPLGFMRVDQKVVSGILKDCSSLNEWLEDIIRGKNRFTDDFGRLMKRYYEQGIVFQSPEKSALYRISSISDASCVVDRLTANAPETINFGLVKQKKELINQQGGRYFFKDLSSTVAIRTTILQDSELGLSVDRKEALLFNEEQKALTHFCELLKNLNVDTSSGEPKLYKPLMLACMIEGIDSGEIKGNKIVFDSLLPRFLSKIKEFDSNAGPTQAAYAFFHLTNELFWMLCYKNPQDRIVEPPSPSKIREKVSHATLKETYWRALMNNKNRQQALNVLAEHWLTGNKTSFWWVNQGKSYQRGKDGGYIWAPQKNRRGATEFHWENVRNVRKGDIVFSYANGEIRAISIAQSDGYDIERPAGPLDEEWSNEGWRADLKYYELQHPISIENIGPKIAELNLARGPINRTGGVNQGYLFSLNKEAVEILSNLIDLDSFPEELKKMLHPFKKKPPIITRRTITSKERAELMGGLIKFIDNSGFVFEPWQVACYVNALRTKPFVILAGVTGTGKSKLPSLVAEATGGNAKLIPVRPDWTDSSDILGYQDLHSQFRPGPLLELAKTALDKPEAYFISIIDEKNLARVEHYFAEVLSQMEDRRSNQNGGFQSGCLILQQLNNDDQLWQQVCIPANLGIVGTVNMDESAHGFSRKVLDRAFTIELSDIDLANWQNTKNEIVSTQNWPISFWWPRAIRLADLNNIEDEEKSIVENTISILNELNSYLVGAQLQVGYRTRDEVALFALHAEDIREYFVTRNNELVDPLDLSILMKILPRIVGGSSDIRSLIQKFLGWAYDRNPLKSDEEADETLRKWDEQGRGGSLLNAAYPRTAARLCLMWDRLRNEGFTSFWL